MSTKRTIDSFFVKPAKKQQLEPTPNATSITATLSPKPSAAESSVGSSLTVSTPILPLSCVHATSQPCAARTHLHVASAGTHDLHTQVEQQRRATLNQDAALAKRALVQVRLSPHTHATHRVALLLRRLTP
jgi:hypothetical protein